MENKLIINGGHKLFGQVSVGGAKNAFLPIMAGAVLCDGKINLANYVDLSDIRSMREILSVMGVKIWNDGDVLCLDTAGIKNEKLTHELTKKVRASIFLLGAILGRFRKAVVAYPGGCQIGARPIDIHLSGFRALGVKIIERHGYIYCNGEEMKPANIVLSFPSVGATESLMMGACLLEGRTTIKNVAKEPEIVDLQKFLNKMGAKIVGAGTDIITIDGVKKLHGGDFCVMPDRIVAGTYILSVAAVGGNVTIDGALVEHNESLISFLKQTACQISVKNDKINVKSDGRLFSISNIQTMPYPFFPTDLQPQMMVLQSISQGTCLLTENVFENRFGLVPELKKMGADINVQNNHTAIIRGVEKLYGADIFACDLRAGAALVMAGLVAEGYTTVYNVDYIDRGYEKIEEVFKSLEADITRG